MLEEKSIKVLHVDDERNQLDFTKLFLEQIDNDMEVDSVVTPEEAVEKLKNSYYDCLISDYKMYKMNGIELAQKVREMSSVPFILYTGQGSEEVAESAFEAGVDDYLKKETEPSHYKVLAKRVRQTVEKHRAELLYRRVVESSRDGIIILVDKTIAYMNNAAIELYGGEQLSSYVGSSILEYIIEDEKHLTEKLSPVTESQDPANYFEIICKAENGALRILEVSPSKITYLGNDGTLCFVRDITSRKRGVERLEAVHQQATTLASLSSIDEVGETTLDIMESAFGLQISGFMVTDDNMLNLIGVRGSDPFELNLPLDGKGVTVKAANDKRSILIANTKNYPNYVKGSTEALSELAVPAVLNGHTVAVLNVESLRENEFDEEDQKLLETLANHVALAFDRIIKQQAEQLGAQQKLEYALGSLEDAERFTSLVKGDLQGTLKSIKTASWMLVEQPDLYQDLATAIDKNADHAVDVSDEIHETVMHVRIDPSLTDLNQSIRDILDTAYIPKEVQVTTVFRTEFLAVDFPTDKLSRVILNLVQNAVEAMPTGGSLQVKVDRTKDDAIITINDTGKGIPPEIMERLYEPFNTSKENHNGLGLSYVKRVLESNNGTIKEKTTVGKGTTFTVTLPLKIVK